MKKMMTWIAVAGSVLALAPSMVSANLIANGDFETGSSEGLNPPASWTEDFNGYGCYAAAAPRSGSYVAHPGGHWAPGGYYQDITTSIGTTYDVSVWVQAFDGSGGTARVLVGQAGSDSVLIGGSAYTTKFSSTGLANHTQVAAANPAWTELTFQYTATGPSTRLGIYNVSGATNIDDVSVIPEPATASMILLFGGAAMLYYRRRRA